jgi:hypothetical protein
VDDNVKDVQLIRVHLYTLYIFIHVKIVVPLTLHNKKKWMFIQCTDDFETKNMLQFLC